MQDHSYYYHDVQQRAVNQLRTCLTVVANFADDVREYFYQNCHAMTMEALTVHVMLISDHVADCIHDLVLRFALLVSNHPYLILKMNCLEFFV